MLMKQTTKYTDSPGTCARKAAQAIAPGEISPSARTISAYCDLRLLDHVIADNGMKLIASGEYLRANQLYRERMARRGRRREIHA